MLASSESTVSRDERAETIIVGGGLEGLSVAWALARRGWPDVLVLERGTVGSGFSAKSSGIIRCHYGVRSIAAMAWRSLGVLENTAEVLDADIGFHRTGYLVGVGPDNLEPLEANVAMQRALGIDVGMVSHDDVAGLFPLLSLDDYAAFAYEPRGGYGDGYLTAHAFGQAARAAGVRVRQNSPVTAIDTGHDRIRGVVLAGGERVAAGRVVVAAGPWSGALVAPVGINLPLQTQREQLMIVDPGQPIGRVPILSDLVSLQYVRPELANDLLVGNSDHRYPEWTDPDGYVDAIDEDYLFSAIAKFQHRFPTLASAGLSSSYAGCYDVTPDYNPVIGASPIAGLYLCAGFSGHGYKISPAVGDLMADIVCDGDSNDPDVAAADFRLERFAEGALLTSPHPYLGAGEMR